MKTKRNTSRPKTASTEANGVRRKKLERLIAEQGVAQTATFENLLGSAADLWASDADFDVFLRQVQVIRNEKD
jgi:hypothetical protein